MASRAYYLLPSPKALVVLLVWLLLISFAFHGKASDDQLNQLAVWYVSPWGSDARSGNLAQANADNTDGPMETLSAAVEKARALPAVQGKRIVVASGLYFLKNTLVLDTRDSGLTIEAAEPGKAILYGGKQVKGWQRDGDRFWSAPLPEVASGQWDFRMLLVNGRMARRARLPHSGAFTHLSEFKVKWLVGAKQGWDRKPTEEELTTLLYRHDDLGPSIDVKNAELTVYHMWDDSMVGLAALDTEKHALRFSNPSRYPPGAFGIQKYVVWNVREGMTEPGQWYLDRSAGKLVYWPLLGEDMDKAQVIAPILESVIRIQGKPENRAHDITLRGLSISVTHTPLQADAMNFEGAIAVDQAVGSKLDNLTISQVSGQGIKAGNVDGMSIENSEIFETGAAGIRLYGQSSSIRNNHVHHVGRFYPGVVAIAAKVGKPGNLVVHNEIHDAPYSGIGATGEGHRIENNRIYRVMQELHDGAAIYVIGGKGIVLKGNFVRDIVDTGGFGASAYYLDELTSNTLIEGNLTLGVTTPLKCHIANHNTIRNNVFINEGDIRLVFPRSNALHFDNNVVKAGGEISFRPVDALATASNNILYSQIGKVSGFKVQVVGNMLTSYDPSESLPLLPDSRWLLTDPRLIELESGRLRYADDSPAVKLSIVPIDVSNAGKNK